jgi:hypothetical protein
MAAMSDYLENKLVDLIFRGNTNVSQWVSNTYVGLLTAAPSDTGGGTEVLSANNYSRVFLVANTNNWSATDSSVSTTAVSGGTSGTTYNVVPITFGAPSGNWGSVTHFGIYSSLTAGNLLFYGALTQPKTINNGDAAPAFLAGQLSVQLDN